MTPEWNEILKALQSTTTPAVIEEIERRVRLGIHIETAQVSRDDLPLGASRMAGGPDLPPNAEWPHHKGRPLDFLAQFDLHEIADSIGKTELPAEGWLYFFYDYVEQPWGFFEDKGSWRVLYHQGDRSELQPVRRNLGDADDDWKTCVCRFEPKLTIPDTAQLQYELVLPGDNEINFRRLDPFDSEFFERMMDQSDQVLGNPFNIQYDQRLQMEELYRGRVLYDGDWAGLPTDLRDRANEWKLLLQLQSGGDVGWWWVAGQVYFWIREQDLRDRSFGDVQFQLSTT